MKIDSKYIGRKCKIVNGPHENTSISKDGLQILAIVRYYTSEEPRGYLVKGFIHTQAHNGTMLPLTIGSPSSNNDCFVVSERQLKLVYEKTNNHTKEDRLFNINDL